MRAFMSLLLMAGVLLPPRPAFSDVCAAFTGSDSDTVAVCTEERHTTVFPDGSGREMQIEVTVDPAQCGRIGISFMTGDGMVADTGPMIPGETLSIGAWSMAMYGMTDFHVWYSVSFYDPPCGDPARREWRATVGVW